MAKKLVGKVAIITGGASGIGEATARLFASHSPQAIVIADIQDDLGQKVAESIGPDFCAYYHCDVTDEEQVKTLVEWTVQKYTRLDIMFSNAGVMSESDQKIIGLDLSEMDRVYAINVRGMAACVKHAARVMVERNTKGSIVCTASRAGSKGTARATDYTMSKHAVLGLMQCASKQLGEYGIRVNSVSPSGIPTPLTLKAYKNTDSAGLKKKFEALTSLKGVTLKVEHVADAVLFLCSDDPGFVTGDDLVIDGGFTGHDLAIDGGFNN